MIASFYNYDGGSTSGDVYACTCACNSYTINAEDVPKRARNEFLDGPNTPVRPKYKDALRPRVQPVEVCAAAEKTAAKLGAAVRQRTADE